MPTIEHVLKSANIEWNIYCFKVSFRPFSKFQIRKYVIEAGSPLPTVQTAPKISLSPLSSLQSERLQWWRHRRKNVKQVVRRNNHQCSMGLSRLDKGRKVVSWQIIDVCIFCNFCRQKYLLPLKLNWFKFYFIYFPLNDRDPNNFAANPKIPRWTSKSHDLGPNPKRWHRWKKPRWHEDAILIPPMIKIGSFCRKCLKR